METIINKISTFSSLKLEKMERYSKKHNELAARFSKGYLGQRGFDEEACKLKNELIKWSDDQARELQHEVIGFITKKKDTIFTDEQVTADQVAELSLLESLNYVAFTDIEKMVAKYQHQPLLFAKLKEIAENKQLDFPKTTADYLEEFQKVAIAQIKDTATVAVDINNKANITLSRAIAKNSLDTLREIAKKIK